MNKQEEKKAQSLLLYETFSNLKKLVNKEKKEGETNDKS